MGKLGDKWAQSYINSRMLFLGIIIICAGIYFLFFQDKVVSTTKDTGKIIKINVSSLGDQPVYTGVVDIQDGTQIQIHLMEPIPQKNDTIPLIVLTYSSGKKEYFMDADEWLTR